MPLDFVISEFRDMKMQPSLERALTHREILGRSLALHHFPKVPYWKEHLTGAMRWIQ